MRGFARRVLEESNRFMEEEGMDIASLFGIRDFYERWGYAPALPEYRVYLRVEDLSGASQRHELVPYSDEHRMELEGMLAKLAPELERRLGGSGMAGRFGIRTDIGSCEVGSAFAPSSLEVALPPSGAVHMVVG